jgi:hypothetical protein
LPSRADLETENRNYHFGVIAFAELETEAVGQLAHCEIFEKDVSNNFLKFFLASYFDKPAQKFSPQSLSLVAIAYKNSYLRLLGVLRLAKPANRENFALARFRRGALGH